MHVGIDKPRQKVAAFRLHDLGALSNRDMRGIAYQSNQSMAHGDIYAFLDATNVDIHQADVADHYVGGLAAHRRRHHVQSDFMERPALVRVTDGLIGTGRRGHEHTSIGLIYCR
jgi:hypothetical protein